MRLSLTTERDQAESPTHRLLEGKRQGRVGDQGNGEVFSKQHAAGLTLMEEAGDRKATDSPLTQESPEQPSEHTKLIFCVDGRESICIWQAKSSGWREDMCRTLALPLGTWLRANMLRVTRTLDVRTQCPGQRHTVMHSVLIYSLPAVSWSFDWSSMLTPAFGNAWGRDEDLMRCKSYGLEARRALL